MLLLASACASNVGDEELLRAAPPTGRQLPPAVAANEAPSNRCADIAVARNLLEGSLHPHGPARGGLSVDDHWAYLVVGGTVQRVPITGGLAESIYAGPMAGSVVARGDTATWYSGDVDNPTAILVHNNSGLHEVELPGEVTLALDNLLIDADGGVFFQVRVPNETKTYTWRWNAAVQTASRFHALDAGSGLYFIDSDDVVWTNNTGLYATDLTTIATRLIRMEGTAGLGTVIGFDSQNIYGVGDICAKGTCPFTVSALPRTGGAPFVAYQTSESYWTSSVRADASGVYWINLDDAALYHAALSDRASEEVVSHVGAKVPGWQLPSYFAMDACNLYWSDVMPDGTTRIMAIQKPPSAAQPAH